MTVTVLCIGDPHIQIDNIQEINRLIEELEKVAKEKNPDLIIILGDVLHTHERLHTIALNKAYEMIDKMRKIAKTYVLVGNHDMINNQVYLNENHWLSGMKEWTNTVIVDKVCTETIGTETFIFVPYVPAGRFQEALNTLDNYWLDASCIFAHQEFAGCKMGAIISTDGDNWPISYPNVVSGHIHSRQIPQENIYYTGSALQNAFGESEKNIIAYLTFTNKTYVRDEIDLKLPRKKIVYMDVEDVDTYQLPDTKDTIKVTLSGNYDQFKALKKTRHYKNLLEKGVKVLFKPKKITQKNELVNIETKEEQLKASGGTFNTILESIITEQKDPYLMKAYELIVNGKKIELDDVMFL
jgi:DNA repair exonuclease SbcCD nuclease subunit